MRPVTLQVKPAMRTRRACLTSCAALAALALLRPASAHTWPQRPVRIVVPFPAGGNSDGITRIVAQHLGAAFGQPFVVENRAGAGGAIGAEAVARSAPDGHTLLMATLGQTAIVPAVTKAAFDPLKDFVPISKVGTNPYVLVVHRSVPVETLAEFLGYVRARPNAVTFAAAGTSDIIYLATMLLLRRAELAMVPVMYRGGAPALADVIAGHVQSYFANLSDVLRHVGSGAIRPLAVSTDKRLPQFPDVPTFMEAGFADFKISTWNGLMAPAGTPKEIVDRLAGEVARAVRNAEVVARLATFGVDPIGNTPAEFAATLPADLAFWADAARIAGVSAP
jgi:tripartite-type tricarboxylate transporter receptor subunit TctC